MAGKYMNILAPDYSSLTTRSLKYTPNTDIGEDGALNPFHPQSDNPLVEGEWLQFTESNKVTRGGSGTTDSVEGGNVSLLPCGVYFMEKGRYDAQYTKQAHLLIGPTPVWMTNKLCKVDAGALPGTRLFVADVSAEGSFKKGLCDAATINASAFYDAFAINPAHASAVMVWSPGYIQQVKGTSNIVFVLDPQLVACVVTEAAP